ncbi:MAG: VOC family protein [Desulfobacterales bacterium]
MKNKPIIPEIHHISAVTASANENLKFYTEVLGLRLVKRTVNFQEHFISGFHSATATLNAPAETATLLTDVLGMRKIAAEDNRTRFQMNAGTSPGVYYDIVEDPPNGKRNPSSHRVSDPQWGRSREVATNHHSSRSECNTDNRP